MRLRLSQALHYVLLAILLLSLVSFSGATSPSVQAQDGSDDPQSTVQPQDVVEPQDMPSMQVVVKNEDGTWNEQQVTVEDERLEQLVPTATPTTLDAQSTADTPSVDAVEPSLVRPSDTQPDGTFKINIVSKLKAHADERVTYSMYFTNTSNLTYNNVLLETSIGNNQAYTGCSNAPATCLFTYTGTLSQQPFIKTLSGNTNGNNYGARKVVWALGTVAPQQYGKIDYTVRVNPAVYPQTKKAAVVLGNTAALYRDDSISTATVLNSDQWGILVHGPIFNLKKTVDKTQALQGDELVYTITVGNATAPEDQPGGKIRDDAEDATNVVIYDDVPDQLTNVVPINTNGINGVVSTVNGRTRITWTIDRLDRNQSRELRFSARIRTDLAANNCNNINNNQYAVTSNEIPMKSATERYTISGASVSTQLFRPVVLQVQASPNRVYIGETVTWRVTVKNNWSSQLNPVTIKLFLPSAFSYTSSGDGGVYNSVDNSVTWSNVTIPQGTFASPGSKQLTVQSTAGIVINANEAIAQVMSLPANVPMGCVQTIKGTANVEPLLSATKTVNVSTAVLSGTNVIYTVELSNRSSTPMTDVSLVDTLPINSNIPFVFVQMLDGGPNPSSVSSTTVRWDNLTVPGGSAANPGRTVLRFVVTARGLPGRCLNNRIKPDSSRSQAREVNSAQVCIAFPWSITKTVDRNSVNPNDSNRLLEFTLTFESHINKDQMIVPMDRFTKPAGNFYTFKQMLEGPPPESVIPDQNGFIYWDEVLLPANGKLTYRFTVELPLDGTRIRAGDYCNRGWMEPIGEGYSILTGADTCVRVSAIEMRITKSVNRGTIALGEQVRFTIQVNNQSETQTVSQLVLSDTLPIHTTFVATSPGSTPPTSVTTQPNGQQLLRWENVSVPPKTTYTYEYIARMPHLIGTYRNGVEVLGGNPFPNLVCNGVTESGNCYAYRDVVVENKISTTIETTPTNPQPGDELTYRLSIINNNNIIYENVAISLTLPLGFSFIEMTNGPQPESLGNPIVWRNLRLPVQQGATPGRILLEFKVKAASGYGVFYSYVHATSTTGIIPPADEGGEVRIIPPSPALTLVGPNLAEIGSVIQFRIMLVNPLSSPLTNVEIINVLPEGFTFEGVDDESPAPEENGQTLKWTIPQVPAMSSSSEPGLVEIVYYVRVPDTEMIATNTVTATGGGVEIDQTYNSIELAVTKILYLMLPVVLVNS